jgi:hypothetical protein
VTVSKAKPQEAKHPRLRGGRLGGDVLQPYLTSLTYLRQEAKRDGLDAIAEIMWDAVAAIEAWLDTGTAPLASRAALSSSLCHSLEFLIKWLALPPDRKRQVAHDIARYEAGSSAETVPRARPGASRKTAS